jgi:hypothetical protein
MVLQHIESVSSSPCKVKNFHISVKPRPVQRVLGILSPRVKRLESKANNSPKNSDEIKKCGSIHPLPIRLHGVVLS